eukprot:15440381-Alexandrium_andersonii.AAC.1
MPSLSSPATPTLTLLSGFGRGGPLGVLRPVTLRGVFPTVVEVAPATEQEVEGTAANPEGWANYRSAEDDASVCAHILDEMVSQGRAVKCEDLASLREQLGAQ